MVIIDLLQGSTVYNSSNFEITNLLKMISGIVFNSLLFAFIFFSTGLLIGLMTKSKIKKRQVKIKKKWAILVGAIIGFVFFLSLAMGFVYIVWGVFNSIGDHKTSFWSQIDQRWILSNLPFILYGAFSGAIIGYAFVSVFGKRETNIDLSLSR